MSNLLMVITKSGSKFVGKPNHSENNVQKTMKLDEVVLASEFMTNNGMAVMGMLLGNMTFPIEDAIICELDAKSTYYQNYYQTTSNIALSKDSKIPLKNH